jgi:hypothetical protein
MYRALFAGVLISASLYAQPPDKDKDALLAEKVAVRMCECLSPLIQFQEKIQQAQTDTDQMMQLAVESEGISETSMNCLTEIEKLVGKRSKDKTLEAKISTILWQRCPAVAQILYPKE